MTINDFKNSMQLNGIDCKEIIISDGQIHRFENLLDKTKNKNAWYVCFNDGQFGAYGDWKLGISLTFSNGKGGELTKKEKESIEREIEKAKQKRLAEQENVSEQALRKLENLNNKGNSEYLIKKQVKSYNVLFDSLGTIYLPMRDIDGKIWSYQQIYNNGNKRFLKGGKKQGCFFVIGKYPSDKIILCEGYATGASIYEATNITTIVCFDAGNIEAVNKVIKAKEIIIAGDNDEAGIKTCKATNQKYIIPQQEGFDFNDVHVNYGLQAVRDYFIHQDKNITYPQGLVGDIARWITETAIYPQPILSISASLALVGALKAHKVRTDTDLRTNIYIMSLAPSGAGKDHPRKMVEKILIDKQLNETNRIIDLLMGEPASGSGLLLSLYENKGKALLQIDEFGRLLSRINSLKAGSYQTEIVDCFLKLFSSANGVMLGKEYASKDMKVRKDIIQPCLCINGITVSGHLYENLKSTEIIDGFLNRFLVFESKERPEEQEFKNVKIPQHIIQDIKRIINMPFNVETEANVYFDEEVEIIPRLVKFSDEAKTILNNFKDEIREKMIEMDKQNNPLVALYGRLIEHTIKVALIICNDRQITKQDILWAINTVKICNDNLMEGCLNNISDNFLEAESKKILGIIKEHNIISKGELTNKTRFLNKKRRNEILEDLVDAERILISKIKKENSDKPVIQIKFLK